MKSRKGKDMQDFTEYSYTIRLDSLEETVRKAIEGGCNVMMVINGEYYDIGTNKAEEAGKDR